MYTSSLPKLLDVVFAVDMMLFRKDGLNIAYRAKVITQAFYSIMKG